MLGISVSIFCAFVTFVVGFIIGQKSNRVKFERENKKAEDDKKRSSYIRRGIMTNSYTSKDDKKITSTNFTAQIEVGELESTPTRSKVEIISMSCNKSAFNDKSTRDRINGMVNNTWVSSNDVEWISDTAKVRGQKIDDILG